MLGVIFAQTFRGVPAENTIKWFPFFVPSPLTADIFLMGLVQTLLGRAASLWPQPEQAPADRCSRQGGVGHSRGRSYQGATECEGQKSRCIQARCTVTRHSSAQGPSEQPALASHRLLFNSSLGFRGREGKHLTFPVIFHRDATSMRGCRYL